MNLSMKSMQNYISLLVFILWILTLGCQGRFITPPFLHGLHLDGFEQVDALMIYNKDNLFDYMNGEAEVYLPLGFQLLYILKYEESESNIQMVVEAYNMDSRSGAEGIFRKYTQEGGSEIQGLGDSAWTDNYILLVWRGSYFLRITPDYSSSQENGPELKDLIELGKAMDGALIKIKRK